MKIAVISDIHANLTALETALDYIDKQAIDKIVCLGDVVGYGPRPNECVELVHQKCSVCLMGNHDHAVLGLTDTYHFNQYARDAVLWTRRTLTLQNKAYLESLPFSHHENELLFVHSTPIHPEEWHYILSEFEAKEYLSRITQKVCFVGHSHIPAVFPSQDRSYYKEESRLDIENQKYIVNVGSVGQPRDSDPRLCFVLFDDHSYSLQFVRLEYPVQVTYNEILENRLPPFLAMRLLAGH